MQCLSVSLKAGERDQIQDSKEVNFSVLNAPHRLLSGCELAKTVSELL